MGLTETFCHRLILLLATFGLCVGDSFRGSPPAHLSHHAKAIDALIDTDLAQSPNAGSVSVCVVAHPLRFIPDTSFTVFGI